MNEMNQSILSEIDNLKQLESEGKLFGEFKNLSNEVYHDNECPALSRSDLVLARRSVRHLIAKKNGEIEKKETPQMKFGTMFHDMVLEPEVFFDRYAKPYDIPAPEGDRRKKEVKEEVKKWKVGYDEYLEKNKEKTILDIEDLNTASLMMESMHKIPIIKEIFSNNIAEYENSYFFKCPITGKTMKYRPDIILKEQKIMIDLKTSADASPNAFRKSVANFYYDLQAYMYCLGASQIFGGEWSFGFIVVEKTAPYSVALYTAGSAEMEMGKEIYMDSVNKIMSGDTSEYAYGQEFSDIGLPAWAFDLSYR